MSKREVMQQALDALMNPGLYLATAEAIDVRGNAVRALRAELAKPEPEPVAWMRPSEEGYDSAFRDNSTLVECPEGNWEGWLPLYRKEDL